MLVGWPDLLDFKLDRKLRLDGFVAGKLGKANIDGSRPWYGT